MPVRECDVAIVGAGPGGLAAAQAAAAAGARTLVIDDNPRPGGQIWRAGRSERPPEAAERERAAVAAGAEILTSATVIDAGPELRLRALAPGGIVTVAARALILATGARELFLPFPGWTLPGVTGAGGLQALAKGGWPVDGARVVVAGSGPLLLAVAAYLRRAGARIVLLADQAPLLSAASLGPRLLTHPRKARQAASLAWALAGVPRAWSAWPVRAEGDEALVAVEMQIGSRRRRYACDYLACGFGLVPSVELAAHLGCRIDGDRVAVDAWQHTTVPDVFAVGEACGIGGVDVALVEGRIAGLAAAGDPHGAAEEFERRARERSFGDSLERAFRLRPELRSLAHDDTVFCRCEDVPFGAVRAFADARDAKLKTRCGMGACQGRVCGAAGRLLLGWSHDRVRPPFYPVPTSALAGIESPTPSKENPR